MYVICLALFVGADYSASPKDVNLRLYGKAVSAEQIQEVKTRAKRAFSGEIEHVYAGILRISFPEEGFRVDFKDEIVETYVIQRRFFLKMTVEGRENREESAIPRGLVTSVLRLFPLKTARLRIYLPDELSYGQAMTLLQAIESRTYRVRPDEPKTQMLLSRPISVLAVVRLHRNDDAKTIEAWTSDGQIYGFTVRPDGFELVRASEWIP